MRDILRQIITLLATLGLIAANALANIIPFNGQTTGEISDRFDVYFVPAGYVFSIWGLIYLALFAYSVYQMLPAQRENPRLQRVGWLYVATCVANVAWLLLWHYEVFAATLAAMVILLVLLMVIYRILGFGRSRVSAAETWLVRVPFSIYLGWITVATIANVTSVLDYYQWGGWGLSPELWAVIMLMAGGVIAAAVSFTRGDVAYVLVIVWAFVGIAVKHGDTTSVARTAWVWAVVAALSLLVGVPLKRLRMEDWVANDVLIHDRW